MKTFLFSLLAALHNLFTSKKFLAALATGITAWQTDGDTRKALVAIGVSYILGQSVVDHAKESNK
jgi:hypothetical protein